jgi:hypothetical protein
MNTNLQYSLAQDHTAHLHRQAANARRASAIRGERQTTFTAAVRSAWSRTSRLRTSLAHVGAVAPSAPLAGDSVTAAHRLRW